MRRFRPRYSLAALMLVITAAAVLLWGVPEWRAFLLRREFERAAAQLKAGPEQSLFKALPAHAHGGSLTSTKYSDVDGNPVTIVPFFYDRCWYCLYFIVEYEQRGGGPAAARRGRVPAEHWTEVRVYRLAPAPRNYSAQTEGGQRRVAHALADGRADPTPRDQYLWDFQELITGRHTSEPSIRYELIHADLAEDRR